MLVSHTKGQRTQHLRNHCLPMGSVGQSFHQNIYTKDPFEIGGLDDMIRQESYRRGNGDLFSSDMAW